MKALWHGFCRQKLSFALMISMLLMPGFGRAQTRVYSVPKMGLFYFATSRGTNGPPAPSCPFSPTDVPVYLVGTSPDRYLIDDTGLERPLTTTGSESESEPSGPTYGTNDFWIELSVTNGLATPIVHGVQSNYFYQVETNLDLAIWHHWTPGEILQDTAGTNAIYFSPVSTATQPQEFFRAVQGVTRAYITADNQDAVEPDTNSTNDMGVPQLFRVFLLDSVPTNVTVYYRVSGSAQNGIDYTNLSGSVLASGGYAEIWLQPKYDNLQEFDETVTLTLIPTNNYVVLPDNASATYYIRDNTNTPVNFDVVASGLTNPTGIDYDPLTNAIIVGVDSFGADGFQFVRIGTNVPAGSTNVTITNWSAVAGLSLDEKKLTIVQTGGAFTNAAGFTNGDLFFFAGELGQIGWINTNGSLFETNWAVAGSQSFRGGLHVDRSGSWDGDLVAVGSEGEIFRVKPNGSNTLVTTVSTSHLEGAVTLTNDVQRWGPLAGRIISGDEDRHLLFAVDTNGYILEFNLGIDPEDSDVIFANQDLYCTDADIGQIVRLSSSCLTNFVGDLLVTQAGETAPAALFVVHWTGDDLVKTRIRDARSSFPSVHFEHVTLAPIKLPTP
jgi:hypothetical protein